MWPALRFQEQLLLIPRRGLNHVAASNEGMAS